MEEDSAIPIGVISQIERPGEFIERSAGNSRLCESVAETVAEPVAEPVAEGLAMGPGLLVSRASSQEKELEAS